MLLMPVFFARLGVKWMLAVGMLAWVIRYGLFAAADVGNVQWMVLGGILLHGICYDFFFVTGFIYTDKKAPVELRGQAQGLLVLITQGLGLRLGTQLIGRIVGRYTPAEAAALQAESAETAKEAFFERSSDADLAAPLFEKANELAGQANTLIDWHSIWLLPCIAAGVVLLLFIAAFRDAGIDQTAPHGESGGKR